MSDCMPGSPYFDEIPKGILTWPKLLTIATPVTGLLLLVGWKYDALIELLLTFTVMLVLLAIYRK
tara:strand:- start:609 stop:803 length:195 start_codon:yes stop_codon:yes gene_type:complete